MMTLVFLCAVAIWSISTQFVLLRIQEFRFYTRHVLLLKKAWSRASSSDNHSSTCKIPDLNPFDVSVMQYFESFTLKCSDKPYLTFVDESGFIHLNKTGFDAIGKDFEQIHCTYNSISGVDGQKTQLYYGPSRKISSQPKKFDGDFVYARCYEGREVIYENCHFYVPPPSDKLQQKNEKLREQGRANVLLLGIDSVSRMSFIRNLPKSYEFLTKRLQSVIMRGFNKVGKNTHPNMIPFLTGHSFHKHEDNPTPEFCINDNDCSGFFDDRPIVWKNFSQQGYVTMFLDEWLQFQLFYYGAEGFKHVPTDYYPRPLIQGLERNGVENNGLCYGNTPSHDVVLDYTDKFTKQMKDTTYFALSFISRISHDSDHEIQGLDSSLQRTLQELYVNGVFNNTILVLFGDHGRRFGHVKNTLIGAVEDRMPFVSIYLPKRLQEQKPHLQAALEVNSARLLGWFDMYEMLMDLAMDNLEEVSRVTRWGFHVGLSPLRPLPENRSCRQAGIPPEYCVCMTPLDVDITEDGVLETAEHIVDHVNAKLMTVPNQLCANLSLHKIESVQIISNPQDVITPNGLIEYLRVTVSTVPGLALLQATVSRRALRPHMKLQGDVERLNMYRYQAACVKSYSDHTIQPYCFCSPTNQTQNLPS